MQHNVAFIRVPNDCFKIGLQRKKYNIILKIITFNPSIYAMDNSDFIVCIFIENCNNLKRVHIASLPAVHVMSL